MSTPNANYGGDTSLGVGQIISEAFNTSLRAYLGIFFLNLPILIISISAFGSGSISPFSDDRAAMEQMIRDNAGRFIFFEVLIFLVAIIASCAMTRLIHDRFVGAPISGTVSATAGARRSLPAFGLLLIFLVAYVVFAFVLALIVLVLRAVLGGLALVLGLGLAIFCLYLVFPYILAGIVCVTEELGPIASLTRSKYLTNEYRWPVLGMLLVGLLVMAVYQGIVIGLEYLLAPAAFGQTIVLVLIALAYPLVGGWMIGLFVIAAHRLRALKGGMAPGRDLSNVFE